MRRRVAVGLAVTLVVAGLAAVAAWQLWPSRCLDEVVPAADVTRPFPDTDPDQRLERLIGAAEGWGAGKVFASVGYDYDRYVDLAALPVGYAVWRQDNPVMAVVDPETADPVWGIRQAEVRHTWDASAERFVMLAAPDDGPLEVSAHAMSSGERRWCVRLDQAPLAATDPISTSVAADHRVLVLAGDADDLRLSSLDGDDGAVRWSHVVEGVDRGDYVSSAWQGVVVVGGRPSHELAEPPSADAEVIAGVDEETGEVRWRHAVSPGATASVAGDRDGQVVVRESGPGGHRLVMLDHETGEQRWEAGGIAANADLAVRGGVLLVRTAEALAGRHLGTGRELWRTPVRQQPQAFPYGFRLAQQPMLDDGHLLLGATDALVRLRLSDGHQERWELPTDGVSTTFWPYRVALSGASLAVATNTGAVLVGGS